MKYDLIIFDADDTLFDFQQAQKFSLRKSLLEVGIDYKPVYLDLYKSCNQKAWLALERGEIQQKHLNQRRFRDFARRLACPRKAGPLGEKYLDNLKSATYYVEGAQALIRGLYGKCKLIIITNGFKAVQDPRIRQNDLAQFFDKIVISEEVGLVKPSPKIFSYALEGLGPMDKSKILMVGDSLSSDIGGGHNFGIDTCWFNPKGKERRGLVTPTYEIRALKALEDLLIKK